MTDIETLTSAADLFDRFVSAPTMRQVLESYRSICDAVSVRPGPLNDFYPKLKSRIKSRKAQVLWQKFDARASHRVYNNGAACTGTRVLIIGAGPCGLRTAIEAQLLGAKVVLIEGRDDFSRHNVLRLWPFLITDLRNLGAKQLYGKFCTGSIDHISIQQLQCILLKVALLLGVEMHECVSFIKTIEPYDCGWRAELSPKDHAVSHYEFDVLVGANGKRSTLEGFKRKEIRGKLAIAITANFVKEKSWAKVTVDEIGIASIYNQTFFEELHQTTGIDLENIVYYKDETHYFVMTAKKHSLIEKGVIIQDLANPAELLAPLNVNTDRLLDYAKQAAEFSTEYQIPSLEFAANHHGKPDVAIFDFTSMFSAGSSSRVTVRHGYRLLQCLVGDSLLNPFWPTGSGCALGFLSSMDAAYAIKLWSNQRNSILTVLAQRESIYRLLAQTTTEKLHRDSGSYTLEPSTRYLKLDKTAVNQRQVKHLLDSDDSTLLEEDVNDINLLYPITKTTPRRKRLSGDTVPLGNVLLRWISVQLLSFEFVHKLACVSECFTNGKVLCSLINRYRPDLVDLGTLEGCSVADCNARAFSIIEREFGIPCIMSAQNSVNLEGVDSRIWLNYLEQICEVFRGKVPYVMRPKSDLTKFSGTRANEAQDFSRLLKHTSCDTRSELSENNVTADKQAAERSSRIFTNSKMLASPAVLNRRTRIRHEETIQTQIETNCQEREKFQIRHKNKLLRPNDGQRTVEGTINMIDRHCEEGSIRQRCPRPENKVRIDAKIDVSVALTAKAGLKRKLGECEGIDAECQGLGYYYECAKRPRQMLNAKQVINDLFNNKLTKRSPVPVV